MSFVLSAGRGQMEKTLIFKSSANLPKGGVQFPGIWS